VPIVISGSHFHLRLQIDSNSAETTVFDRFSAVLRDANREYSLDRVERRDQETLTAEVPAAVPIGSYDLMVNGPAGQSNTLEDAYVVCDDADNDGLCPRTQGCGDSCQTCMDADGDGWGQANTDTSGCTHVGSDCDDSDNSVHPGAVDIPDDTIDQDCNGTDTVTCIVDADRDGHGTVDGTVTLANDGSCDTADQESTRDTDCDDGAAWINPNASEAAGNLLDENCDGSIDCYVDADQDGYGTDTGTTVTDDGDGSCLATSNESLTTDDCDDNCAVCWTGHIEDCGDGEDNNCSGIVDEGCACPYGGDSDGECALGTVNASNGACDAPPTWEASETTCDDLDNDCDAATDEGCDDDNDNYCDNTASIGASGASTCSSTPAGGFGNDCDDQDAAVYPGIACACTQGGVCENDGTCGGYQTCDGSCSTTCDCANQTCDGACWGANSCCEDTCPGGSCPTCISGCSCDMTCDGVSGSCNVACDSGSRCHMQADNNSTSANMNCDNASCYLDCDNNGTDCEITCVGNSTCEVFCDNIGGNCLLSCPSTASCRWECRDSDCGSGFTCTGTLNDCGSFRVCNRPCP
jgi:hypothetical protein